VKITDYGNWLVVINFHAAKTFYFKNIDDLAKYLNSIKTQPVNNVFVAVTINGEFRVIKGKLLFNGEQVYVNNHNLPPIPIQDFINTLMPVKRI
jgi:alpha-acetolactate decarboxylase